MRPYIGAKIVMAEGCYEAQFAADMGKPAPLENRPGYKVKYADDYVSWSPKDVFEEAYRPVSVGEKVLVLQPEELPPLGVHVSETIKFKAD